MVTLAPVLTPHGVLTLARSWEADAALVLEVERGIRLERAFARGSGHGLLVLGGSRHGTPSDVVLLAELRGALRDGPMLPFLASASEASQPCRFLRTASSTRWPPPFRP